MTENPFNLEDPRDRVLCAWLLGELDETSPEVRELREREPGIDLEFQRLRRVESTIREAGRARARARGPQPVPDLTESVAGEEEVLAGFRATMARADQGTSNPASEVDGSPFDGSGPSERRPLRPTGSDVGSGPTLGSRQLLGWIAAAAAVLLVVQLGFRRGGDPQDSGNRTLLNSGGPVDPGTSVLADGELQWTLETPDNGSYRLEFRLESSNTWDPELRVEGISDRSWSWDGVEPNFDAQATYRWRVSSRDEFGRVKDSLNGGPYSPASSEDSPEPR